MARFRADTSELEAGSARAKASVSGIGDAASQLPDHLSAAGREASALSSQFAGAGSIFQGMTNEARSLKTVLADVAGVTSFAALTYGAVRYTSEIQTLGVQQNAIFGQQGPAQLRQMTQFADQMGVSVANAGSAWTSFGLATKGSGQNMMADTKTMQDAAAGTGSTIDQVAQSVGNYYELIQRVGGQGGSASRFASSLLTQHIIDPETYNALRTAANQGASANDLLNQILGDIQKNYGGTGAEQAKTLGNQIQTFKNELAGGTVTAFAPAVSGLAEMISHLNTAMQGGGFKTFTEDISKLIEAVMHGVAFFAPFVESIVHMGAAVFNAVGGIGTLTKLVEALVIAFIAFKGIELGTTLVTSMEGFVTSMRNGSNSMLQMVAGTKEKVAADAQATASTNVLTQALVTQQAVLRSGSAAIATAPIAGTTMAETVAAGTAATDAAAVPQQLAFTDLNQMETQQLQFAGMGAGTASGLGAMGLSGAAGTAAATGGVQQDLTTQLTGTGALNPMVGRLGLMRGLGTVGGLGLAIGGSFVPGIGGSIMTGAGIGMGLGTMVGGPGIGTAVGAGVGAAAGAAIGILEQNSKNAAAALTALQQAADKVAKSYETQHPTGTTMADITSGYQAVRGQIRDAHTALQDAAASAVATGVYGVQQPNAAGNNLTNPQYASAREGASQGEITQQHQAVSAYQSALASVKGLGQAYDQQKGALYNAQMNMAFLSAEFGSTAAATKYVTANNIDLSQNVSKTTSQLQALGGVAGQTAESLAAGLGFIGTRAVGQQGQSTYTFTQDDFNQMQKAAQAGNVDMSNYGVSQALVGTTMPTPQAMQQANVDISTTMALRDAQLAVTQAQMGESQASWSLTNAIFAVTQAQFQQERAQFQLSVTNTTASEGAAGFADVMATRFLPTLWNAGSIVQQLTGADQALGQEFLAQVAVLNSLEAVSNQLNLQLTILKNTLQTYNDELKVQQDILNQPLVGTKAQQQQEEAYKQQAAGIQAQMDILKGLLFPTQDPHMVQLQFALNQVNTAADLLQQQAAMSGPGANTVAGIAAGMGSTIAGANAAIAGQTATPVPADGGLAYQQAQIAIDKMNTTTEVTYADATKAAASFSALQPAIVAAQLAVDRQAISANAAAAATQLQANMVQGLNTVMSALSSADQTRITQTNAITVGANQLWNAENNVAVAQLGVKTATNALKDAQDQYQEALNTYRAQEGTNIQALTGVLSAFETQIGAVAAATQTATQALAKASQTMILYSDAAQVQSNASLASSMFGSAFLTSLQNTINWINTNGPTTQGQMSNIAGTMNFLGLPGFQEGGVVPGAAGAAMLAVVHGGETVLPLSKSGGGGNSLVLQTGAIQISITVESGAIADVQALSDAVAQEVDDTLVKLVNEWQTTGTLTNG